MLNAERIYCQTNLSTGLQDWFFSAREGNIGPFSSKETANQALNEFVKFNSDNAWDGGRSSPNVIKTFNKAKERFLSQIVMENQLDFN